MGLETWGLTNYTTGKFYLTGGGHFLFYDQFLKMCKPTPSNLIFRTRSNEVKLCVPVMCYNDNFEKQ